MRLAYGVRIEYAGAVSGEGREVRAEVERRGGFIADNLIGRPGGGGNVAGAVEHEFDPVGEGASSSPQAAS